MNGGASRGLMDRLTSRVGNGGDITTKWPGVAGSKRQTTDFGKGLVSLVGTLRLKFLPATPPCPSMHNP